MKKEKIMALVHRFKHAWVFAYFIFYMIWFTYLERQTNVEYYPMHMRLDDVIPFCEYFIIPYMLWFVFIAITVAYFFFTNVKEFYKCIGLLYLGMTISLVIYTLYPNEQLLRPAVFSHTNLFTSLVQFIYNTDTCTNVCPSIHVLNSICVFASIMECPRLRAHKWITHSSGLLATLICMSTVFLKQHSMIDVLCGAALAIGLYACVYRINYAKLTVAVKEYKEKQKVRYLTKKQKS